MGWINWVGECAAENASQVEEQLFACGAVSVTYEDSVDHPIFEPAPGEIRLWAMVKIKALFDDEIDRDAISAYFAEQVAVPSFYFESVPDTNWVRASMDQFKAQQFGTRLWVVPSWLQAPQDEEAVVVSLDPGVAFGTGTHPTTAMCLTWLDSHPPLQKQVLDFGCGSGILAIAALKLGADYVCAVDIDPQAVEATENNAQENGVSSRIEVGLPEVLSNQLFDVVIANILAGPLVQLSTRLMTHLSSEGVLVLSGLLSEQAAEVMAAYPQIHWMPPRVQDEWVCLCGARKK